MDSKLRRLAILGCLGVILLVSLLVVYANRETDGMQEADTAPPAASGTEEGNEPSGGDQAQAPPGLVQVGDDLDGFLKDETFFDQVENPILEQAKDQTNRLSLVVTSIEKDLRVQIVNMVGEPVSGESFYVEVDGLGEYKDLDQDGIVYIGEMEPGEYYVSLRPMEGWKVPVNETKVKVKDKVEYLAIEDISLFMRLEEEVDAQAEDTGSKDAAGDADKTEIKKIQIPASSASVGMDISSKNGEVDWNKVTGSGVDFAIIRAGYRGSSTGTLIQDTMFTSNMRGAVLAGMKTGVSFFSQAVNEVEAVEEASMVLELIQEYSLEYPVFLEIGGAGAEGRAEELDQETRTAISEAFCATIKNAGYEAGVYAGRSGLNNQLTASRLENYCIWLAEYRSVPLYQGYYQMWQYTSKGKVDGIQGEVNLNISYLKK